MCLFGLKKENRYLSAATITVCATGCDFTTIAAAVADPGTMDGDVIDIQDAVHTEAGIVVRKSLTFQGQGQTATIVQAHASPSTALDQIFIILQRIVLKTKAELCILNKLVEEEP